MPFQPGDDPCSTPIVSMTIIRAKKIFSVVLISLPFLYACLLRVPPSDLFGDTNFWFLVSNAIILVLTADSGAFASSSASSECRLYDEYMKHSRRQQGGHQPPVVSCLKAEEDQDREEQQQPPQSSIAYGDDDDATEAEAVEEAIKCCDIKGEEETLPATTTTEIVEAKKERSAKKQASTYGRSKSETMAKSYRLVGKEVAVMPRPASACSTAPTAAACNNDAYYWSLSDEELNWRVEEFIRRFNRETRLQDPKN